MYGRNLYGAAMYGATTGGGFFLKALSAVVSAAGSVARKTGKGISATVNASVSVGRKVSKGIAGVVNVSGDVSGRRRFKALAGIVAVSGDVSGRKRFKTIAGVISVSGSIIRKIRKGILGAVNVEGSIPNRRIWKTIDATVNVSGTIGRAISKALATVVNVSATVVRVAGKLAEGGVLVTATVGRVIKKAILATVAVSAKVPRQVWDMAYEMNKTIRQILGKVQITYTDPFFSAGIVAEASETGRFTYPAQTTDNVTEEAYKWFSLHRNLLDGTFHLLPSNQEYSVGWWSATLCSGAGVFLAPPVLTITHAARTVESLLVVGDDKLDEYPTWFVVRLYTAGDVLVHTEAVNTGSTVTWSLAIDPHDDIVKQTLTIARWSRPDSVAKIAQFFTMLEETYQDGDLFSIRVLEEREFSQPTIPQGNISSNVLTVRLNNIDDLFNAGNFNSRLYGYLLNNRAIRAWLGCDLHSGVRHWFPLGTFYTRDWNAPEGEAWAEVTGYDMMDRLKQTEFSVSQVYENITLYDLAVIIMADAGLTSADWDIDAVLDTAAYTIPYAWFNRMSHREALRRIAAAALGQVYCNRDGKIVLEVYVAPVAQPYDFEFYEGNYFDINHPLEWSQMINSVQARANPRVASAEQDICLDTEAFTVPGSSSVTKTHFFDSAPCVDVVDPVVFTQSVGNISLGARTDYAWGITQVYTNAAVGDEDVLTVTIRGKPLEVQGGRIVEAEDTDSIAQNGRQTLSEPITSEFWQTEAQSQAVADSLLASYKDPRRDVVMKARGNIALLLGDRVVAPDYRDEVTMEYGLMRQDIDWDGGMEVAVTAQKIIGGHLIYHKHIEGVVGVSGTIYENLTELAGAVVVSATVGKTVKKSISVTVNVSGAIEKTAGKMISGVVSAIGSRAWHFVKPIAALIGVSGSVGRTWDFWMGSEAIDRIGASQIGYTYIMSELPATISGEIITIKLYGSGWTGTNMKVGTFSKSGLNFTPRDFAIIASVSPSEMTETAVSIDVEPGDYLGVYTADSRIKADATGVGVWLKSGDGFGGVNAYTWSAGQTHSCRGEGTKSA